MLEKRKVRYQGAKSDRVLSVSTHTDRSHLRLPSLHPKTIERESTPKPSNFDKYYIQPGLRYRRRKDNPKKNPENYEDETFIYKNLHNPDFWNWVHPLHSEHIQPREKNSLSISVNLVVLEGFRKHVRGKTNSRVPMVVDELLSQPN